MIQFMQDVYDGMKTFMVGMKVTGTYWKDSNMHEKETVTTIDYDGSMTMAREVKLADRFRGHLHNDIERCIVCKACAKACPIDCFWIDGEKTETNKLRPSRFDIDLLKCMYCGLCVFACPTGCLTMTKEWWGATFNRDGKDGSEGGGNLHGQLRQFGVKYYTDEQKVEVERKRVEIAEAKKKAAAEAAAKKKAADEAAKAAAAKPAGDIILPSVSAAPQPPGPTAQAKQANPPAPGAPTPDKKQ